MNEATLQILDEKKNKNNGGYDVDNYILDVNYLNKLKPTYQNKQYAIENLNYPAFIKWGRFIVTNLTYFRLKS